MKPLVRILTRSLAAAVLTATPCTTVAQAPVRYSTQTFSMPSPGDELVVTYDTNRNGPFMHNYRATARGTLKQASNGYLVLDTRSGTVVVQVSAIRSIRRRIGTKSASAPAMALGSAAGFTAGFLIGALAYREDASSASSASNNGLAVGVLLGAPAGAFVAWLASRRRPIYEDLELVGAVPAVSLSPSGRLGLTVSVSTP